LQPITTLKLKVLYIGSNITAIKVVIMAIKGSNNTVIKGSNITAIKGSNITVIKIVLSN